MLLQVSDLCSKARSVGDIGDGGCLTTPALAKLPLQGRQTTGCAVNGHRQVLGMAIGDAETTDFWTEFLRSLAYEASAVLPPQ